MNSEVINILCATDENYAPYCGIMLTSLFDSNRDCWFNVYIFESNDVSEANQMKFNQLGNSSGNVVNLMRVEDSMVKELYLNKNIHITLPTYFRLFVADLLPLDVHKVLYLDCDIIVTGDIVPLWETDVKGKALACVINRSDSISSHCERLGYPVSYDYFNAGMILMNIQYWRENHVRQKFHDYAIENGSNLVLMDQDVLNGVLFDKKVLLPERYNFQILLFETKRWESFSQAVRKHCVSEGEKVQIIHYVGPDKPWNFNYGGPFFSLWEKYRRRSLWRDSREKRPMKKRVKHFVKRYLFYRWFGKQHPEWAVCPENKAFYYK